jgi:hypothetical protein
MPTAAEIKKALKEAGLELYRTRGDVVFLADRVRENLLMDAGTFVRGQAAQAAQAGGAPPTPGARPRVGFVVRAQRTHFPNDGDPHLFDRARNLAAPAIARGYLEIAAEVRQVLDPGDDQRTIDTWCEISFEKEVDDLGAAMIEARFALALEKAAAPSRST